MASEERQNTVTIGGILLQRDSGGFTIVDAITQYGNVRDDQLQMFWHWYNDNEAIQKAKAEWEAVVSQELMAWGDQVGLEQAKGK